MTEVEWLAATDPRPLLKFLRGRVSDRKLRLFAAGCWRRRRGAPARGPVEWVIRKAERLADGAYARQEKDRGWLLLQTNAYQVAAASGRHLAALRGPGRVPPDEQAGLLRDVVEPFRAAAWDPRWRTADAVGLARGIYEDRAFDRLPLLADALLDAGCDRGDILGQCRSDGPHVRGCWVVDLVLGKE